MPPKARALARLPKLPALPSTRKHERDFLPAALEIIETPASPAGRAIGGVIIAAAVISLVWAYFGQVDIIATATGQIVSVGRSKTIQPLETGLVRAIHVADGDHVNEGDLLVELDSTNVGADRDRYQRDLMQAQLDLAKDQGLQQAFNSNREPVLDNPPASSDAAARQAVSDSMQAIATEQRAKLASLDQQITEKRAEGAEAAASVARLKSSLPLVAQEADIRTKLKDMQYGNKIAWLESQQKLVEQQHEIEVLTRHHEQSQAAEQALHRQREQTQSEYQKNVLSDLDKSEAKIREMTAELTKAEQKFSQQDMKAPISGTVQQLAIHTVGGVVTPAQPLMVIVPDTAGLIVEASVRNQDVGFVHIGQPASVKVETFNFTRYGLIDGKVVGLSRDVVSQPQSSNKKNADTASDDDPDDPTNKSPTYVARIALDRDWMETESGHVRLGPGMAVRAEIKTGKRRIIDYLLSPLSRRAQQSAHER